MTEAWIRVDAIGTDEKGPFAEIFYHEHSNAGITVKWRIGDVTRTSTSSRTQICIPSSGWKNEEPDHNEAPETDQGDQIPGPLVPSRSGGRETSDRGDGT